MSKRYTIGIDPGADGAIAVHHPDHGVQVEILKNVGIDWLDYIGAGSSVFAVIEKAQAMPGQGVTSMFNYGLGFGKILGWLEALGLPYTLVTPREWTKEMHRGCTGTDAKKKSLQACQRLFPAIDLLATQRSKVPHKGIVDALLIMEWGRRNIR